MSGGTEEPETPAQAAVRELLEETGLRAREWRQILRIHLSNSVTDEESIVYLATDLEQGESSPEETERLVLRRLPFAEVLAMVQRGEITDSITVAAVLCVALEQRQK